MLVPCLDEFPLAIAYGWREEKRARGGLLWLYPPQLGFVSKHEKGLVTHKMIHHSRIEAINPDDFHPIATDTANEVCKYYAAREFNRGSDDD